MRCEKTLDESSSVFLKEKLPQGVEVRIKAFSVNVEGELRELGFVHRVVFAG